MAAQLFDEFTNGMFLKLMRHSRIVDLSGEGEVLYKKGEASDHFYFVLKGQILITRVEGSKEDFSLINTHNFMSYQPNPGIPRNSDAFSHTDSVTLIEIDSVRYREIMHEEELKNACQKMSFLERYGPKLRQMDRISLQEKEVLF